MPRVGKRPRFFTWLGVVLCGVALLVIVVPVVGYARVALSDDEVRLPGGAQQVSLPAGETWGVYVNDANNSGYSEQCSAVDATGRQIPMRDPWWTVSGTETETLDFVFDTGSGELTINCSVPGEQVTIRPVPNLKGLVVGIAFGGVLGAIGLALALNWALTRPAPGSTQPWAGWGPEYLPGSGFPTSSATGQRPVKRSARKVVGITLLVVAVAGGLVIGARVAWNAAITQLGEQVAGGFPDPGEYYEVPGTDDAALIAAGDTLLAEVGTPPGAVRDPYGTACWVLGVSLCMTSEELEPGDLLDATTAQLRDRGADLKKRWCFIDQCYTYLKYQGAPLMLVVDVPEEPTYAPTMITGWVVTTEAPDAAVPPGAPLGSWASLAATPKIWRAPTCMSREAGGCRQYQGDFSGPGSAADAVSDLRRTLKSNSYASTDTCPATGPVDACTIEARRFLTAGSRDGVVLRFRISAGEDKGFRVSMEGKPYPD